MLLSRDQINAMDEASLRAFLGRAAAEGQYLDYKEALSGGNDREQRREFLKDVTGFANGLGGNLVIGAREPQDGQSVDVQLVGIPDGEAIVEALENVVRDSTEPRIPGFILRAIQLQSGKSAIVAHIPPSSIRPHMVNHGSHRTFYIRRGASTVPMTVMEIRDAVLSAATAEGRAREVFAQRRADSVRYYTDGKPALLLQATPLVQPDFPWPVEQQPIMNIARGSDRLHRYHSHGICTEYGPRITIDGLHVTNNPEEPFWIWEIHRSGYVSILVRPHQVKLPSSTKEVTLLHAGFHDPFFVLAEILDQIWRLTGFDVPYAFHVELFPARGSTFKKEVNYNDYSKPFLKDELVWPLYMRQPGEDPRSIAKSQIADLYRAYGLWPPANIEPPK
jgi:hypothetical protein